MPKCLNSLKVAFRKTARGIPSQMANRSAKNFAKRVNWRVEAGGGHFKRKMAKTRENLVEFDSSLDRVGEECEADSAGDEA